MPTSPESVLWRSILVLSLALVSAACDDSGDGAGDAFKPGDGSGWVQYESGPVQVGDGGKVIVEDGGATIICYPTTCAGKLLECGDCEDNDGDGRVDWRDPECLGPCDNTEGPALIAGVGGDTGTSCGVDCYFDYGNGPGNDDCFWDHRCDPLEPEQATCPFTQKVADDAKSCPATQSKQCLETCLPFTPNGCDCFGCCTFPALAGKGPNGSDGYVWIGAFAKASDANDAGVKVAGTCTLAAVDDPVKCPPCTPVQDCLNACGKCELCLGKTSLPPECTPHADGGTADDAGPAPPPQCDAGVQPCGLPGQPVCEAGYYCISGCCIQINIE